MNEQLRDLKIGESVNIIPDDFTWERYERQGLSRGIKAVLADIDERKFKDSRGNLLYKNEIVEVKNKNGRLMEFRVHRILGGMFILLAPKNINPKLGFMDSLKLAYKSFQRKL